MPLPRFQYRLRTLMALGAFAAYGMGLFVQSSRGSPPIGRGARIATAVVASRAARPRPARWTSVDPLLVVGSAGIALFAVRRRRAGRA